MSQAGISSRIVLGVVWLPVGLALIAAPVWIFVTRTGAMLGGHPATIGILAGVALLGIVATTWAILLLVQGDRYDRYGDPDRPRHLTRQQQRKRSELRLALSIPALLLALGLIVGTVYVRPFEATPVAVQALRSDARVQVTEQLTWYEMAPARRNASGDLVQPTSGLVFVPGARVDPRAYANILRPVAAAGYLVVVLREPLNFALPNSTHAESVIDVHPRIRYWTMGGHSLGGVNAAAFADRDTRVNGLLLYASYPAAALNRMDLKAMSISGSKDGLTTPDDIEASKAKLPRQTRYVVIDGAVHAYFGDYGDQPGDGVPTVNRVGTQAVIAKATLALLASIPPPPKKR